MKQAWAVLYARASALSLALALAPGAANAPVMRGFVECVSWGQEWTQSVKDLEREPRVIVRSCTDYRYTIEE